MEELTNSIKHAMLDHGVITDKYKITLVEITGNTSSDYRTVTVEIIKPRCRKPVMAWDLRIDIVRGLLLWEESTFYYL